MGVEDGMLMALSSLRLLDFAFKGCALRVPNRSLPRVKDAQRSAVGTLVRCVVPCQTVQREAPRALRTALHDSSHVEACHPGDFLSHVLRLERDLRVVMRSASRASLRQVWKRESFDAPPDAGTNAERRAEG